MFRLWEETGRNGRRRKEMEGNEEMIGRKRGNERERMGENHRGIETRRKKRNNLISLCLRVSVFSPRFPHFLTFPFLIRFPVSSISLFPLFIFFVLCALCPLVPSAQEVEVHVEMEKGESPSVEVMETPIDEDEQGRESKEERLRRLQQDGQRLPPEVRKIMEEENISPEDLMDPEIRRKLFEKVRDMRKNPPSPPFEKGGKEGNFEKGGKERNSEKGEAGGIPEKGEKGGPPGNTEQKGAPGDEGLKRYMDAIVAKNLFLPLGSGRDEKKNPFALTAVMSGSGSKAIIKEKDGGRSYYVSEGDTFANKVKVVDIGEQVVKLDRSGEEMTLRLGEGIEGGRPGGGRGERGPGERGERRPEGGGRPGGELRRGGGPEDSDIPLFIRKVLEERGISIDELRRNPELQEKLRREFEGRFGGGRPPREVRVEVRP